MNTHQTSSKRLSNLVARPLPSAVRTGVKAGIILCRSIIICRAGR
jgi:hypothetical protein